MTEEPQTAQWPPQSMSVYQYAVIALCCMANIADGFDVVSLALAAPVLTKEWGITPQILGTLFSAAAVGLTIGAFLIAPMADKIGRRPIMLGAMGTLAIALLATAFSTTITQILILRFITGIGLGTLVVCLNTCIAEFASDKSRNISLAILHTGFTIGMMLGGGIAALLLETVGWRAIFTAAGILNAVTFLLSLFLLAESPHFLMMRRREGDLSRLNKIHAKMKMSAMTVFPAMAKQSKAKLSTFDALLGPGMRKLTILIWITAITYAIVGYFQLNWKPTILANAGLSPSLAAAAVIITGAFGTLGHLIIGILARRVGESRITTIFFAMAAVSLTIFGLQPPNPIALLVMAGVVTFFVVGAYTGLFLVAVIIYPPAVKNAGVGFIVGFGRIGAIAGPMIGGFLLGAGLDRMATYFVFSAIAVIPAIAMFLASKIAERPVVQP
ncbi:MFS transporter [Parasphingorhabdus sp.]|uniref:MFS transporter n=1 Tax=Parasphingorhabdus sp. TaxID=2709688 RepID=UPI003A948D44